MIACLGWGSLVWNPDSLRIQGAWRNDGPMLPLEFARQSSRGRLTLVLLPRLDSFVRSLWVPLAVDTVVEARDTLATRESVRPGRRAADIGQWSDTDTGDTAPPAIGVWARQKGLAAVVWAALPAKFDGVEGRVPTADEAVAYLRNRQGQERVDAEEYVRRAPRQIASAYRRRFEAELGWTPI